MDLTTFFPSVVAFSPNVLTPVVDTIPVITVVFNVELNVNQINTDALLNDHIILVEENSDSTIPVHFLGYLEKVLTFSPQVALNPGSSYQVTILSNIESAVGRQATANASYAFTVTATEVPQVVLSSPPNFTSVSSIPNLIWNPVITAATTGATGFIQSYEVQLDSTMAFNTVDVNGFSTVTLSSSALPGVALTPSNSYFWRVRGLLTYPSTGVTSGQVVPGEWSDPYVFYLGTFLTPSPDTRQTYPEAVTFSVQGVSWSNGETNLPEFPNTTVTFSTPIATGSVNSSTVYFTRESIDGWPDSVVRSVNSTVTVSGNFLYITITDNLIQNNRYVLNIYGVQDVNGNTLAAPVQTYFTSSYSPLYLGASVLRANFGKFLIPLPDDLLNFYIYRASLDVNRNYLLYYNPLVGGPDEMQVRSLIFIRSYAMERWVECEAGARLLEMRLFELVDVADSSKRLADYSEEHGFSIIKELEQEIRRLRKESLRWISEFSRHRARVETARKSERNPTWERNTDYSFQRYRRDQF